MSSVKVPNRGPVIAAVLVNLVPIVGVMFWGWSAFALIFLYWLENVVIGVRTVASIGANALIGREVNALGALFFAAFFTVHYGIFCYGHGAFVVSLFGASLGQSMLDIAGAGQALFAAQPQLIYGLASIIAWQIVQLGLFIGSGEARTTNPLALMGRPYPRIIVLHITILIGGFVLLAFNQPVIGLVILALVKMAFDIADVLGKIPRFDRTPPAETQKLGDAPRGNPGSLSGPPARR